MLRTVHLSWIEQFSHKGTSRMQSRFQNVDHLLWSNVICCFSTLMRTLANFRRTGRRHIDKTRANRWGLVVRHKPAHRQAWQAAFQQRRAREAVIRVPDADALMLSGFANLLHSFHAYQLSFCAILFLLVLDSYLILGSCLLLLNRTFFCAGPARPGGKRGTASGPSENRGSPKFFISVKFSIRLLKARDERKPNKVIEKSVLVK